MDVIKAEILDDGTISIQTEGISDANHFSADELLEEIEDMAGGKVNKKPLENKHWKHRKVQLHGKIIKHGKD